jgi:superfamily II DNA or RNA helicase
MEPVNNFIKAAEDPLKQGGIISVPCGFGKTIMAIYITCYFKKKTMFVSHKDFLNQQFISTLKLFVPEATVGIIKQKKVDIRNKDVVIASLQSLAMRDYDPEIFKEFGLVIFDECHHISSEVFSRALQKMNIPITLGLSATLNRKDGLRKVFEWYLGKSVYKHKNNNDINMSINIHKYYETNSEYSEVRQMYNGKPNMVAMINNICNYKPRTLYIIDIIKKILEKEPNRKLLILSERRNQLKDIEELIISNKISDVGYYVGGMSMKDLDLSAEKQIILATYQMSSEGLNIPTLNTVIFASPISDIQQSIGRILREKKEERKYIPLCIDIWDEFSIFKNKGWKRIKYYNDNKYDISYYINNEKMEEKKEEVKFKFIEDDD